MNNRYGLDVRYFKEKLGQLMRDAENYAPDEMDRALVRLALVARHQQQMRFDTTDARGGEW